MRGLSISRKKVKPSPVGDLSQGASRGRGRGPQFSRSEGVGHVDILDIIRKTISQRESVLVKNLKKHSQLKSNQLRMRRVMCTRHRRAHNQRKRHA